jgi:hypothetical protein
MNHASTKPTPARRRAVRKAAAAAIAIAATCVMTLGPATTAHAQTWYGCPDGWVCLYPQDTYYWNSNPEQMWYTYGYHNLSNVYGTHYIFNNQTGNASIDLCYGYNGTNCTVPNGHIGAQLIGGFDFTPINSVVLNTGP